MNQRGAMLFEALLVLGLLCAISFPAHLAVIRKGRKHLEALEALRLPYDGLFLLTH